MSFSDLPSELIIEVLQFSLPSVQSATPLRDLLRLSSVNSTLHSLLLPSPPDSGIDILRRIRDVTFQEESRLPRWDVGIVPAAAAADVVEAQAGGVVVDEKPSPSLSDTGLPLRTVGDLVHARSVLRRDVRIARFAMVADELLMGLGLSSLRVLPPVLLFTLVWGVVAQNFESVARVFPPLLPLIVVLTVQIIFLAVMCVSSCASRTSIYRARFVSPAPDRPLPGTKSATDQICLTTTALVFLVPILTFVFFFLPGIVEGRFSVIRYGLFVILLAGFPLWGIGFILSFLKQYLRGMWRWVVGMVLIPFVVVYAVTMGVVQMDPGGVSAWIVDSWAVTILAYGGVGLGVFFSGFITIHWRVFEWHNPEKLISLFVGLFPLNVSMVVASIVLHLSPFWFSLVSMVQLVVVCIQWGSPRDVVGDIRLAWRSAKLRSGIAFSHAYMVRIGATMPDE